MDADSHLFGFVVCCCFFPIFYFVFFPSAFVFLLFCAQAGSLSSPPSSRAAPAAAAKEDWPLYVATKNRVWWGDGQPCSSTGKWGCTACFHPIMRNGCWGHPAVLDVALVWSKHDKPQCWDMKQYKRTFHLHPSLCGTCQWGEEATQMFSSGMGRSWDWDAAASPPPASHSQQTFKVHYLLWEGSKPQGLPQEKTLCSGCEISRFS